MANMDLGGMLGDLNTKMRDFLGDLNFPTSKDEIIKKAKESQVGSEIIEKLQNLPDQTYDKLTDVMKKIGM